MEELLPNGLSPFQQLHPQQNPHTQRSGPQRKPFGQTLAHWHCSMVCKEDVHSVIRARSRTHQGVEVGLGVSEYRSTHPRGA